MITAADPTEEAEEKDEIDEPTETALAGTTITLSAGGESVTMNGEEFVNATKAIAAEPTIATRPALSDLENRIINANRQCKRAEAMMLVKKEELKYAKEEYDGAVEKLRDLCSELENDLPENRPLFQQLKEHEETPASSDLSWRAESIDVLDSLTEKVRENLRSGDVATLGELTDLVERIDTNPADNSWPRGIGKEKAGKIVDALTTWLAANRDAQASVPVTEVIPDAAAWEAMSVDDQCSWLCARAVAIDSDDTSVLDLRETDNEEEWQCGCDSFNQGDKASNCPHAPGVDCDSWLCGWLWQGKQEK